MFGLHRNALRKILAYSVPPGYRRQSPPRRPKLEPFTGVVMPVGRSARPVLRSTSNGRSVASESCCNLCNCGRIQIDRP